MTETEQRIAIAAVCGWTDVVEKLSTFACDGHTMNVYGIRPKDGRYTVVPLYHRNLDIMREIEVKHLTNKEGGDYDAWLWIILKRDWEQAGNNLAHLASWHASAAQKCEAFLKVKGRWKRAGM